VPLLQGSVLGISKQEIFSAHHWALAEVVLDALAVVGDKKRTRSFRPLPLRTNRPRSSGFPSSTSRYRTSLTYAVFAAEDRSLITTSPASQANYLRGEGMEPLSATGTGLSPLRWLAARSTRARRRIRGSAPTQAWSRLRAEVYPDRATVHSPPGLQPNRGRAGPGDSRASSRAAPPSSGRREPAPACRNPKARRWKGERKGWLDPA